MIGQMFELMYEHKGVGLAANQVDLPYRMFVANPTGEAAEKDSEMVFINPVLSNPKGQDEGEEGCLSMPGVHGDVRRAEKITVAAFNLAGEEIQAEVDGLLARILQHETDHLDGKLFIDRLSVTAAMAVRDALEELEADFASKRGLGHIASDADIAKRLADLEQLRT